MSLPSAPIGFRATPAQRFSHRSSHRHHAAQDGCDEQRVGVRCTGILNTVIIVGHITNNATAIVYTRGSGIVIQ
jgi:hypothetical protein